MNYLADIITSLSLASGFSSIIFSLENHFTFASWAIIISVILDGLDGQVARRNPFPSEFGKELDSLVDVISFGIAPSILGYIFVYRNFYVGAAAVLFIYLFCSVLRLAKYNITPKEKLTSYFYGLPTTVSGGILASFILIYRRYTQSPPPVLFLLMTVIMAILMISKIKYMNLEGVKAVFTSSVYPVLIIILTNLVVLFIFYSVTSVFLPELIIFVLFIIYLIFSPFMVKLMHLQ